MISLVMPLILMSICRAVTPRSVPATLKSMSPRWSSSPRMSVSTAKRLPSLIKPIAMPATCAFMGTPASMRARLPPHTDLLAEDVGEHGEALAFLDQAHRDARDVRLHGHARVHESKAAPAHRCHRRGCR